MTHTDVVTFVNAGEPSIEMWSSIPSNDTPCLASPAPHAGVGMKVCVGVGVTVGVLVGVDVGVRVGVRVGVDVGVDVDVFDGVLVGVAVAV